MTETNKQIKKYLRQQQKTDFINVYRPMLDKKKQLRPEIYEGDMLHMKPQGYEIWTKAIRPYLIKK